MYATVVINISSKQLNRVFDYKIPSSLTKKIKKGMRVIVDFKNKKRLAFVVDIIKESKHSTKEILYVLDEKPTITPLQFKLVEHLQKTSFSTYNEAFLAVIPPALRGEYESVFFIEKKDKIPKQLAFHIKDNKIDIKKIKEEDFSLINEAIEKGYIKKTIKIKDRLKRNETKKIFIKNISKKLTEKQSLIIHDLEKPKLLEELLELGHSKNIIDRLIKQNILGYELVAKYQEYKQTFNLDEKVFNLTPEQEKVLKKINLNTYDRYLLYGPPASGKTEIYLRLVEQVLKIGKQVLIMVPEISLVPQMVARVRSRFSHEIAIYHSSLTARARYDNYLKVKEKSVPIIIGVRSSVFLPINNLGLIIMDEAHDMSYYQKEGIYYDTKELSYILAESKKCPVILGTATPTVSLYYNAKLGKLKLLELKEPIVKNKVNIKLIDMKKELLSGNLSMFSRDLKTSIKKTYEKNEQIIILVNRRGYAPFVLCRVCGYVPKCLDCNVSLVYHKNDNKLKCHHCGYYENMTTKCSVCKNNSIKAVGFGIQQVEEALLAEFKDIKVLRMDRNTVTKSDSHDKILAKFLNNEADVLLGTQMVSKGHHFTNVSLVVVMLADQMLNLNSYLANENTYNLLTQHIGRIRNKNGHAILQAYNTDHFVLKSVLNNDFKLYYNEELQTRKLLNLDPFYDVVKITFKGTNQNKTYNDLNFLKTNFLAKNTQVKAFGPSENYIFHFKGRYNYSVTFKIPKSFNRNYIMKYFDEKYRKEYYIDIDYYPNEI